MLAALIAEAREDIARHDADIALLKRHARRPVRGVPNGYMALKTVAIDLGCNPETLRLWCVGGKVDAARVGMCWFVRPESVKAHLTQKRIWNFGASPNDRNRPKSVL